jgi:hypothetical protein
MAIVEVPFIIQQQVFIGTHTHLKFGQRAERYFSSTSFVILG